MQRRDIVLQAQTWIGTPYRHQQSVKGSGVDCVGLILGVGSALSILHIPADRWRPYARYARLPNPRRMTRAMNEFLVKLEDVTLETVPDGAIAWIQWRERAPMHLAIIDREEGQPVRMIHALSTVGECVHHIVNETWESRIVSYWDWPGAPE